MYTAPLAEMKVTRGGKYGGIRRHKGVDLVAASGTLVYAPVGGIFHSSGFDNVHGFWGIWKGDDGNYWNAQHLLRPFDARGRINAEQIVGVSGATGDVTGPHLHVGVSTIASLTVGTFDPEPLIFVPPPILMERENMYVKATGPTIYCVFTDANGHVRLRTCGTNEAAIAVFGNRVVTGVNDATLTALGVECGWPSGGPEPVLPLPVVAGGSGGGYNPADTDVVDEGELGQALTSTVQLINDHIDQKFAGLTLTTP